jgi:hypothetical protein
MTFANGDGGVGSKYLTDTERDLVLFIEKFHTMAGVPPEEAAMLDYMKSLGYNVTPVAIQKMLDNPLFKKSMDARGILIGSDYKPGHLTVRQMAAAQVMTNPSDRRSEGKRLADLGITVDEWNGWRQNKSFNDFLIGKVERLLADSVHEAHLGLIKGVRNGNVPAIKLLYEITNRYNPDQENQVNVRLLLGKFVEVIQKYVKDPEILGNMARELQQVAYEAAPAPSVVRGQLER